MFSSNTVCNYDPTKFEYDTIHDACWKPNEKVPFCALIKTLEAINTNSNKIRILSNYLSSVMATSNDDIIKSVYLCQNKIAPDYESVKLNISPAILLQVLSDVTGIDIAHLKKQKDPSSFSESLKINQKLLIKPKVLTIECVFDTLKLISTITNRKLVCEKIKNFIFSAQPIERYYIINLLYGKIYIEDKVLISAITLAYMLVKNDTTQFKSNFDENVSILQTAFNECPSHTRLIQILLKHGFGGFTSCMKPGIAIKSMLAHPCKGIQEALHRLNGLEFTCEYKYDGERAQIHFDQNKFYMYSRNHENTTEKYPDVVKLMLDVMTFKVNNFIIDCEIVAYDIINEQILPFQQLSTRKRKNVKDIKVNVCLFVFDIIYLNGDCLNKKPLYERRQFLQENFKFVKGRFMPVTNINLTSNINLTTNLQDTIQDFLHKAIIDKCEGIMIKTLNTNSCYEISKRTFKWLKLKKDYIEGLGDTFDLTPIGAYFGRGKRSGVYGSFLLACYDEKNDEFQSICKIGSGFSDKHLQTLFDSLNKFIIPKSKSYYNVNESIQVDVWFEVNQVWEIKCADLSISPIYKAGNGIIDKHKGLSLRFPRFVKIRNDKKPKDCTTTTQILELYLKT